MLPKAIAFTPFLFKIQTFGDLFKKLYLDNYAEDGVPADIGAAFDWSDLTKDEILEKAIDEIVN